MKESLNECAMTLCIRNKKLLVMYEIYGEMKFLHINISRGLVKTNADHTLECFDSSVLPDGCSEVISVTKAGALSKDVILKEV